MKSADAPAPILHLVRHGESEGNVDPGVKRRIADADIGLTREGERQASAAGRRLAAMIRSGAFDPSRTMVDVSPYTRKRATWALILEALRQEVGREVAGSMPVTFARDLREIDYGAFHGLDEAGRAERFPEAEAARIAANEADAYFRFRNPGGESRADVATRSRRHIDSLLERSGRAGARSFIIVGHGTAMRTLAMEWLGEDAAWFDRDPLPGNASIRILGERGDHGYATASSR